MLSMLISIESIIYILFLEKYFFLKFYQYKPIGAAPGGHFFVGGGGGVWAKKFVMLRGLRISEKKEILRKPTSIVSNSKLCTIQYCNITIPYCNIVPYYVKSIAIYHIAASAGMPHPSRPRSRRYRSAADVSPPLSHRTGPSSAAIS
jgi:hypothetical protein